MVSNLLLRLVVSLAMTKWRVGFSLLHFPDILSTERFQDTQAAAKNPEIH